MKRFEVRSLFGAEMNWVLWFMDAIRSFGGEYIPMRNLDEPKKITGRRANRLQMRAVPTLKPGALKKIHAALKTEDAASVRLQFSRAYYRDKHGSLRRVFPKAA